MSSVAPKVGSYHDFQGLGELRGQAQRKDDRALREVAQQFEAMFVQQIMKTMREAGFKGAELVESQALDTFQSMHDKEISLQMARRGSFGLADMLVKSMERHEQAIPAAQMLNDPMRARPDANKALPLSPERSVLPLGRPERAYRVNREPVGPLQLNQGMSLRPSAATPDHKRSEPK
jgi:flagellar protein FlgJ